jgi:transposase
VIRREYIIAVGNSGAGKTHIASLIETCKMNDVDPQLYLRDVLSKIVARRPISRIDELLPFAYVPAAERVAA